MVIKSIHVQNFRCIRDETLPCERLTRLIGPNGSGKSSFLRALEIFYSPSAKYTEDDFYNRDPSQAIVITITFIDLTKDEQKLFQKYVEAGKLTVEKVIKWPAMGDNQKYYGTSLRSPDFESFRSAKGPKLKTEYKRLREGKYPSLREYVNKDEAESELQTWEISHPEECSRMRDEGQFFGFKEVGEAHLERHTRFILVPAVREASEDATERKGTPLTEIMDLVVRSVLAQRKEITELQEGTQRQYKEIVDPSNLIELQTLERELGDTLKTFVPDAGVKLTWLTEHVIDIPMPKADIKLIEDEYPSSVERTGHGLQRAFILTMLQHLTVLQSPVQEDLDKKQTETKDISEPQMPIRMPNLIIGMEEPELYQHPNRQRHLSKVLMRLAMGSIKGVAESTQIIYSTHSPLFVDIMHFGNVRMLRKVQKEINKPKQTKVTYTNLDEIAKIIDKADGKPEGTSTGSTLKPRLQTLMTPWMNEGFFADVLVLVEGEDDRAAIVGVAAALGRDLESMGISVIPCMSKGNLHKAGAIFRKLEIPVYIIWDSGCRQNEPRENNHRLLRFFEQPIEDYPEKVTEHFACFKDDLHETLSTEIGKDLFHSTLQAIRRRLCLDKEKYAVKNHKIIEEIIVEARNRGKTSKTLERIISNVVALRQYKI